MKANVPVHKLFSPWKLSMKSLSSKICNSKAFIQLEMKYFLLAIPLKSILLSRHSTVEKLNILRVLTNSFSINYFYAWMGFNLIIFPSNKCIYCSSVHSHFPSICSIFVTFIGKNTNLLESEVVATTSEEVQEAEWVLNGFYVAKFCI